MSELRAMLLDANERLLKDYCRKEVVLASEGGVWAQALWGALEAAGITAAVASERTGGSGIELSEALRLAGSAAAFSAPIPLGENYLATWILGRAGLPTHQGPASIAPSNARDVLSLKRQGAQWRLTGLARRVPWARHADAVVVVASGDGRDHVALVPPSGYSVKQGSNIAREARDTLTFDAMLADDVVAPSPDGLQRLDVHALGAALRTVQLAAALRRTLELTVRYAQDREQFGRSISKFQAIQHHLAVLASQTAVANAAADIALESLEPAIGHFNLGATKVRAGEAASVGAALAHQVHGAIGFTLEYELNLHTRRLWSWRDEFGNEAEWSSRVGHRIAAAGSGALWATITSAGNASSSATGTREEVRA